MKPILYLFEQHFSEFNFPTDDITPIAGIAYGKDKDTVFHALPTSIQQPTSGMPINALFFLTKSTDLFSEFEERAKEEVLKNNTNVVFVFLVKRQNSLQCHAYLICDKELIECKVKYIPRQSELFSRSKGMLETDALANKSVGIVGLGSGGSLIAIELAKAGIGNFVLIDFDRLELANISRHVCGVNELGRLKTLAVSDAIRQKNPDAIIETFEIDITEKQEATNRALTNVDLIIGASDNDRSRFLINEIALEHKIPALFGRALTRAIGGDVLRVRPFQGPCYSCLYAQHVRSSGGDDEEISQEKQAQKLLPGYTSVDDLQATIQVGLAADIAPIANMMVKLALVELSKGIKTGISSLEKDFTADFYIWANRRENAYEHYAKLGYNFNQPSILRWYGAQVDRDTKCMVCGT